MDGRPPAARLFLSCHAPLSGQSRTFRFYFKSGHRNPVNLKVIEDSLLEWDKVYSLKIRSLRGYADSTGTEALNQRLSENRAERVKALLAKVGIDTKDARTVGYGERYPLGDNGTAKGKSKNRRVDMSLIFNRKIILPPLSQSEKKEPETVREIPEKDTIITLEGGTELEIKAGCLLGMKLKDIKVQAKEYYTEPDMIINDMFTQDTGGAYLETGGMLDYQILDRNGKPVILQPGCSITIRIPQMTEDTVLSLFDMPIDAAKNPGWSLRPENVKYLNQSRMFEFSLPYGSKRVNLDKYFKCPKVASQADEINAEVRKAIGRRKLLKIKGVFNAKAYTVSKGSIIKMPKIQSNKFRYSNRRAYCVLNYNEYFTIISQHKSEYYYCHKKVIDTRTGWLCGRNS